MNEDYRKRLYDRYVTAHLAGCVEEQVGVRAPYLLKLIDVHFPKEIDTRILEIGCGHGALLYYAKKKGYKYLEGVDISPEQVREAWHLGLKDNVRQGNLMEILRKCTDNSYGVVIAFDVMEHMTKNELLDLVEELNRVLCDRGKLILHLPNAASPFFGRVRYGDYTHEQAFTQSSLSQLLVTCGFCKVQCFEDTPIVHGIKSVVRWFIWKGIRSILCLALAAETGTTNEIFTQNFLAVAIKG